MIISRSDNIMFLPKKARKNQGFKDKRLAAAPHSVLAEVTGTDTRDSSLTKFEHKSVLPTTQGYGKNGGDSVGESVLRRDMLPAEIRKTLKHFLSPRILLYQHSTN